MTVMRSICSVSATMLYVEYMLTNGKDKDKACNVAQKKSPPVGCQAGMEVGFRVATYFRAS